MLVSGFNKFGVLETAPRKIQRNSDLRRQKEQNSRGTYNDFLSFSLAKLAVQAAAKTFCSYEPVTVLVVAVAA